MWKVKSQGSGLRWACIVWCFWFALGFELSELIRVSQGKAADTIKQTEVIPTELIPELANQAYPVEELQFRGEDGWELVYSPNSSVPFDGLAASFHDNGQVEKLFFYEDGVLHSARGWNHHGEPSATRVENGWGFVMELEDEKVGYLYDRGMQIAYRGRTDSGKLYRKSFADGIHVVFYSNGVMREQGAFSNGRRHGIWKTWNTEGGLVKEFHFERGSFEGVNREWHENGAIKKVFPFKDGKPDGEWTVFGLDGEVLSTSHFAEGKPEGKWKTLHEDGSPGFAGSFENGEKTGVHRWWKKDGKLRKHFLYHNGNPIY